MATKLIACVVLLFTTTACLAAPSMNGQFFGFEAVMQHTNMGQPAPAKSHSHSLDMLMVLFMNALNDLLVDGANQLNVSVDELSYEEILAILGEYFKGQKLPDK